MVGSEFGATFGPGCPDDGIVPTTRKLSEGMTVSDINHENNISTNVKILYDATIQITVAVPYDQDITFEMVDAIDPSFHDLVHDGRHVTVDDPLVVTYDLGGLYSSTYEARITGKDGDVIPLILHRPLDEIKMT